MKEEMVIDLLRRVTVFGDVDDQALQDLSGKLEKIKMRKDQALVEQDDPGDALFVIRVGRMKVVYRADNGREVILSLLKPGDFFGEMSLIDGEPRSADVVALEAGEVVKLSRAAFIEHLHQHPSTALNVMAEMCKRLRHADSVIGNLAVLDVYGRVARVLQNLADQDGEKTEEGLLIRRRPTQQDLASMIGTSRETVSRVLSEFQRRGYLSMQGKSILLSHGFSEAALPDKPEASDAIDEN